MTRRNWKQLVGAAIDSVYPALQGMTDAELRIVRNAPKRMTNTNCWWLAYSWAPQLAEIADGLLKMRQAARRKDRRLKTHPRSKAQ